MNGLFMATCIQGAEEIVSEEIKEFDSSIRITRKSRGRIVFKYKNDSRNLNRLRCIDNIYLILGMFAIGPHKKDLLNFAKNIAKLNINNKKIIVSAAISGKHTYSRFDLSREAEKVFETKKCVPCTSKEHDFAVRIDVENGQCIVSQQLTLSTFKFRGTFNSIKGGLRPSLAHCLIRVSRPSKRDVFYDPFCGGGTIAMERSFYPCRKILASDISEKALETAYSNLNSDIVLFKADATQTGMKKGYIDTVVTNMPWGKQVPLDDKLYDNFFKELHRLLKPDGKAVILTDRTELLINACRKNRFHFFIKADLSLHGLHPKIFEVKKMI